jgi:hypothetical protein
MSCPFLKLALRATYRRSTGCGGTADYSADRARHGVHHYPLMGGAWARTPISRISPNVISAAAPSSRPVDLCRPRRPFLFGKPSRYIHPSLAAGLDRKRHFTDRDRNAPYLGRALLCALLDKLIHVIAPNHKPLPHWLGEWASTATK